MLDISNCKYGDIVYCTINDKRVYDRIISVTSDKYGRNIHVNLTLGHYIPNLYYKKLEYGKGDYVIIGKQGFIIKRFAILYNKVYIVTDDDIAIPLNQTLIFCTAQEYNERLERERLKLNAMKLAANATYGIHCIKQPTLSMINLAKEIYKLNNKTLNNAFEAVCKNAGIITSSKQEIKNYKYINDICVYEEIK